jgi:hypothetical protein
MTAGMGASFFEVSMEQGTRSILLRGVGGVNG